MQNPARLEVEGTHTGPTQRVERNGHWDVRSCREQNQDPEKSNSIFPKAGGQTPQRLAPLGTQPREQRRKGVETQQHPNEPGWPRGPGAKGYPLAPEAA